MAKHDDSTTPGWEQAAKDADLTLWLSDSVPVYFRKIVCPPEGFWMGSRGFDPSEEPMHRVRLEPFYIATFPVTQEQWRAVVEGLGLKELDVDPSDFKGRLWPVEQVSWDDATAWCEALRKGWRTLAPNRNAGLTVNEFVLPLEAEWEYACKRDAWHTEYANGDGVVKLEEIGGYSKYPHSETHSVGEGAANAHRLYDMQGSVWEWCADVFDDRAYCKRRDGWEASCWTDSSGVAYRVLRGGSLSGTSRELSLIYRGGKVWSPFPTWLRPVCRDASHPRHRGRSLGFRICLRSRETDRRSSEASREAPHGERISRRRNVEQVTTGVFDSGHVLHAPEGHLQWNEINPGGKPADFTKFVVGVPNSRGELTAVDLGGDLPRDFALRLPKLTHLSIWGAVDFESLPPLPLGLTCLDIRFCQRLSSLNDLPKSLEILVLQDCENLEFGRGVATEFPALIDCCISNSPKIPAAWVNAMLARARSLIRFEAFHCTQLASIDDLPEGLRTLKLSGCKALKTPPKRWHPALTRIDLNETAVKRAAPRFSRVHRLRRPRAGEIAPLSRRSGGDRRRSSSSEAAC